MQDKIKIGVLGVGHLGKIHLRLLHGLDYIFELVGYYDPASEKVQEIESTYPNIKAFPTVESLIDAVDAIDIVTPTLNHFECAKMAIQKGKHVFVEKPLTNTIAEAKVLQSILEENSVKFQVGHVERFNPAFIAAREHFNQPMFIESHRLSPFNPRGTDVSVVLDLMIHDLDIVLSVVKSPVKAVYASGVNVISENPDIANARIEFENGCVANLTASRTSFKVLRKSRFFQSNGYLAVDFGDASVDVFQLNEQGEGSSFEFELNGNKKQFDFIQPEVNPHNAIEEELKAFAHAINEDTNTEVDFYAGFAALELAHQILDKIKAQ